MVFFGKFLEWLPRTHATDQWRNRIAYRQDILRIGRCASDTSMGSVKFGRFYRKGAAVRHRKSVVMDMRSQQDCELAGSSGFTIIFKDI